MNIAICDDEAQERQRLQTWLTEDQTLQAAVTTYDATSALIQDIQRGTRYDLIFLDIELPGDLNGMEAAQRIRRLDDLVMQVFITSHRDFMSHAFEVEAMDFLVKPVQKERFLATLARCRDKFYILNQVIFANVEEAAILTARDIYYISSMTGKDKNYVMIHDRLSERTALTAEERGIKIRMTMSEVEKLLTGKGFYRCQSGYLVNWMYVKRIYTEKVGNAVQNKVLLVDGDWQCTLPVSRDKKQEMLRIFHSRRRGGAKGC